MDSLNNIRKANFSEWHWPQFSEKSQEVDKYDRPESFDAWFRRSTCIIGRSVVQVICLTPLAIKAWNSAYYSPNSLGQILAPFPALTIFWLAATIVTKAFEIFELYKSYQNQKNCFKDYPQSTCVQINVSTVVTALALAALGHQYLALTTVVMTVANTMLWYSHAYLPSPLPTQCAVKSLAFQKDEDIRQKIHDLPVLKPGEYIHLNLFYSQVTDKTLHMLAAHVFQDRNNLEENIIDLRGCEKITERGAKDLLTKYPKLHLDLTDCGIEEQDVQFLRYDFPKATIEYYPIYKGLVNAFHSGQYSDISFLVEGREIKAHKFIFAAFDKIPDTSQKIIIDGIPHDEFKIILEEIYSGKLQDENRLKLPSIFEGSYNPRFVEKLFNDPSSSDFKIIVEGKEFHVHRAILGHLSDFFKTSFNPGMREAAQMKMVMPEWIEKDCQCILRSFYQPQIFHDLEGIYGKIAPLLSKQISYQWQFQAVQHLINDETVTQWLELARRDNLSILKKKCLNFLNQKNKIILGIANDQYHLSFTADDKINDFDMFPAEILDNVSSISIYLSYSRNWDFVSALSQLPNLKNFDISFGSLPISLNEAQLIQIACPGATWRNISLMIKTDENYIPFFEEFLKSNPEIQFLHIPKIRILDFIVWKAIYSLTHLKLLAIDKVDRVELSNVEYDKIFSCCPNIEQINISDCYDNIVISHGLKKDYAEIVESNISFSDQALFKKYPNPSFLDFEKSNHGSVITPDQLSILLQKWPQITKFRAKEYDISDAHLGMIAKHCPQLKELCISNNTSFHLPALIDLLKKCKQIDSLFLEGCTQLKDEDIKILFSTTQPFEKIFLEGITLSVDTVELIIKASPLLEKLQFSEDFNPEIMQSIHKKYPKISINQF